MIAEIVDRINEELASLETDGVVWDAEVVGYRNGLYSALEIVQEAAGDGN